MFIVEKNLFSIQGVFLINRTLTPNAESQGTPPTITDTTESR